MTTTTQITIGTGGTYATPAAFATALSAKNFVADDAFWDVRVLANASFNGLTLATAGADATRYCRIRPAAGQGVNDLNADTLNFPATGITLDANVRTPCLVGLGVVIEGFRITIVLSGSGDYRAFRLNGISDTFPNAPCGLRRNRISTFGGGVPVSLEGANNADTRIDFSDNYMEQPQYDGDGVDWVSGFGRVERNTFVNKSATKTNIFAGGLNSLFRDNLGIGFSASGLSHNGFSLSNNFTDAAGTATAGHTVSTLAEMCVAADDYRAKPGGTLIGAASASAQNTLDIFGNARGTSPDVGAAEYYVAVAVPAAPTNVVATGGNGSASVSFTPGADNGSAITGYTVTASTGQTATGTASPISIGGLPAGPATFTVTATNGVGTSAASAPSNSVTITIDTAGPVLSSAVATNGDTIVLTFNETLGNFTPTPADFTFSGAQATAIARSGATITLSGFANDYAFGNTITVSYAKPAANGLRDLTGNMTDSFGPAPVTNNIAFRPVLVGYTVKQYGDDPSHDFSTADALNAYVNGLSLNDATGPVMIYCHKNLDLSNRQFGPTSSDDNNFVTLRPVPGQGFSDLESDDAPLQYGTVGLELVITTSAAFRMGMEVTGWRVKQTSAASNSYGVLNLRRDGWDQPGTVNRFHHNKVLIQHGSPGFQAGEYGAPVAVYSNLFVVDANNTAPVFAGYNHTNYGNTYVRLNGAAGYQALIVDADNCLFFNCGGNPLSGNGAGNFTNTAQTTPKAGLTTVTGAFFVSATNYRPAAGSPILGGATSSMVSTNDINGNNRGLQPDAGAAQLVAAQPLPTGTLTQQYPIDGQTLKITLTTTNTPTSGKISLTPANPANGASAVGPLDLVLGAGTATAEVDDIPPGNYLAPTITLTNGGGTVTVPGTKAFEIMGVGNLVYDGGLAGTGGGGTAPTTPAPTIAISTPDNAIMSGKRATASGPVNVNGDPNAVVNVFLDPQPSGAALSMGPANVSAGTWTIQDVVPAGLYKLRAVVTSNGQTAQASTGNIRVLKLVGNFNLPSA